MSELLEQTTPRRPALLSMIGTVGEVLAAQEQVTDFIAKALKSGRDYGVIPGTKTKPVLYKAGAERLCQAFGVYVDFEVLTEEVDHYVENSYTKRVKEWNNAYKGDKSFRWVEDSVATSYGLYRYVVKAKLYSRSTGELLGTGIGACSSMESKYIDRPLELENTILKMAEKRAMTAGIVIVFALSERFNPEEVDEGPAEERPKPASTGGGMTAAQANAWLTDKAGLTLDQVEEFKAACKAAKQPWMGIVISASGADSLWDLPTLISFAQYGANDGAAGRPPHESDQAASVPSTDKQETHSDDSTILAPEVAEAIQSVRETVPAALSTEPRVPTAEDIAASSAYARHIGLTKENIDEIKQASRPCLDPRFVILKAKEFGMESMEGMLALIPCVAAWICDGAPEPKSTLAPSPAGGGPESEATRGEGASEPAPSTEELPEDADCYAAYDAVRTELGWPSLAEAQAQCMVVYRRVLGRTVGKPEELDNADYAALWVFARQVQNGHAEEPTGFITWKANQTQEVAS